MPDDRRAELGPVLPPRAAVYAQARELAVLAKRAAEFSGRGATADLSQALRQFERMRVILGPAAALHKDGFLGGVEVVRRENAPAAPASSPPAS